MKIFAQHGFGPKDKLTEGVDRGLIDGVILSPRYLPPDKMKEQVKILHKLGARVFMDPEFYATDYMSHPEPNLGSLEEWSYFQRPRRRELISGAAIPRTLSYVFEAQRDLGVKYLIAPNIYIREADSMDTAVALNFITQAKIVAGKEFDDIPVYATLAIHRDAILSGQAFRDILDALTSLEAFPDGYYILIGSGETQNSGNNVRSDLYNAQVLAGWMYMNYVLSINGANVINGCCHLTAPLVGICGAEATASGWFSSLRNFCIDRYGKQTGGGRTPSIRYVSNSLLSHIKQTEYETFRSVIPAVANGLPMDSAYKDAEPSRTEEALQSWEALNNLSVSFCTGNVNDDLKRFSVHIDNAENLWAELQEAGFRQSVEANLERLEAMKEGIKLFKEWAELA